MSLIIIEGAPGCGKTTFTRNLSHIYSKTAHYEVFHQAHLERYLKDPSAAKTLCFNMRMYTTKLWTQFDAKMSRNDCVIDRGIEGNKCFTTMHIRNNKMSSDKWNEYVKKYAYIEEQCRADKVLYLRVSPQVCMDRVKMRGRPGECVYNIEYFEAICAIHDDMFMGRADVIVVDWNKNYTGGDIKLAVESVTRRIFASQRIVIEGNIGSGKSVFIKEMRRCAGKMGIPTKFVSEKTPSNFEEFLLNQKNPEIVKNLQMETRRTRTDALNKQYASPCVIFDRGLDGDECFAKMQIASGMIDQRFWDNYKKRLGKSAYPYRVVYLHTDPETCIARCVKRGGVDAESYSLEYFKDLGVQHDAMLLDRDDVCTIEWTKSRSAKEIRLWIQDNFNIIFGDI